MIHEERPWVEVVPWFFTFVDRYCHLYILRLLRYIFLAADSQHLFSSPQRAHVTLFVKHDKLELAIWLLCIIHAVLQVPLDGVVGRYNICCHFFAASTVDVTVCFSRQTVNALTSGLLRYSAHPPPCWLNLAHFGQKTGCWRLSCYRHPQSSPLLPWDFFVIQMLPQHKPSCIRSQTSPLKWHTHSSTYTH